MDIKTLRLQQQQELENAVKHLKYILNTYTPQQAISLRLGHEHSKLVDLVRMASSVASTAKLNNIEAGYIMGEIEALDIVVQRREEAEQKRRDDYYKNKRMRNYMRGR